MKAAEQQALWAKLTFMVGIAGTGAVVATLILNSIATKAAVVSAGAAKDAAKASLAALSRPWLYIEQPIHNQQSWTAGYSGLVALLSITNHGTAPAIIHSLRGAVFPSPGPKSRIAEIAPGVSHNIIDFPEVGSLWDFRNKECKLPFDQDGTARFRNPSDARGVTSDKITVGFVQPTVIGVNQTTGNFRLYGRAPFAEQSDGLRLESAMTIYLIGSVTYSGPDERIHTIEFCYRGTHDGKLIIYLGPPYNRRYDHGDSVA